MNTKYCRDCEEQRPIEAFSKNRSAHDGLQNYCRHHAKLRQYKWREKNRDKVNASAARYRAKLDPVKVREYHRTYQEGNPDKVKSYRRRFYERHRDEVLARTIAYQQANPDKRRLYYRRSTACRRATPEYQAYVKSYREQNTERIAAWHREYRKKRPLYFREAWRRNQLRRRAAMRVAKVDYDAIWERDGGICHICGGQVERADCHFDHVIPLSRGGPHTYDNIKVSHGRCNMRKHAKIL